MVTTRIVPYKVSEKKQIEEEHLATNISNEELTEKETRELYYGRWEIEKSV